MVKTRIPDREIEQKANEVLSRFYSGKFALPIDVEGILEISLGLKPIIEPNLKTDYFGEAFLTMGKKQVVIDEFLYSNESRRTRLVFSLAHEIGHFILHGDIFHEVNNAEEYLDQMHALDDYTYKMIEKEADIFAGFLLMPRTLIEGCINESSKPLEDWDLADTASMIKTISEKIPCSTTTAAIQCRYSKIGELPKIKMHLQTIIDLNKPR